MILDNLGSHKGKAVRRAIRDIGARLVFLPKYSPDLNPIEEVFAKFKALLRKVGARAYEAISDASAKSLPNTNQPSAPHTSSSASDGPLNSNRFIINPLRQMPGLNSGDFLDLACRDFSDLDRACDHVGGTLLALRSARHLYSLPPNFCAFSSASITSGTSGNSSLSTS